MGFHGEIRVWRGPQDLKFIRELDVCTTAATLQDFRPEKDLSLFGVPNRMATDFVELMAMPFSQTKCEKSSIRYDRIRYDTIRYDTIQ